MATDQSDIHPAFRKQAVELNQDDPLIAALPPKTDYFSYLTIVEYNLTPERLPTLHSILQDTELTQNIGWDLVHLLMPMLPESDQCLQDIARLGNPREVVLKVTEFLRLIEFESIEDAHFETNNDDEEVAAASSSAAAAPNAPQVVLPVLQLQALVNMLTVLHPRIKTRNPGSFLSGTLQAILLAYNNAGSYAEELTDSVIKLVRALTTTKRPHLPPRKSTSDVLSKPPEGVIAPDPEAEDGAQPTENQKAMTKRLLQSFITHILEDYMLSLSSAEDVPGMAWGSRLLEKMQPSRVIPGKPTMIDKFSSDEQLQGRISIVGNIAAIARDLGLKSDELLATAVDVRPETTGEPSEEEEPPSAPEDIPLSKTGSFLLLTARKVSEILYDRSSDGPGVPIFPTHATLLQNFVGATSPQLIGLEPEALIDALLALSLIALENDDVGEPADDEAFT
ncbi:hypothetical protein LTS18_005776, partial [Coniosporium uncinatum]